MARIKALPGSRAEGAGESDIPSATSSDEKAARIGRLSRRVFLLGAGAVSAGLLAGCGGAFSSSNSSNAIDQTTAWQLSTRGVGSASRAAKSHAANKRFVSAAAADTGRAHSGDKSRVVSIDVSPTTWQSWFGGGQSTIDLRNV